MYVNCARAALVALCLTLAPLSVAGTRVRAVVAADNHGLYVGNADESEIEFVAAGSDGGGAAPALAVHRPVASYRFETEKVFVYLLAWSADANTPGLLAEFNLGGVRLLSGQRGWQVFKSQLRKSDGDAPVSSAELAQQLAKARGRGKWREVSIRRSNSPGFAAHVALIDPEAKRMWARRTSDGPRRRSANEPRRCLIFRYRFHHPRPEFELAYETAGGLPRWPMEPLAATRASQLLDQNLPRLGSGGVRGPGASSSRSGSGRTPARIGEPTFPWDEPFPASSPRFGGDPGSTYTAPPADPLPEGPAERTAPPPDEPPDLVPPPSESPGSASPVPPPNNPDDFSPVPPPDDPPGPSPPPPPSDGSDGPAVPEPGSALLLVTGATLLRRWRPKL